MLILVLVLVGLFLYVSGYAMHLAGGELIGAILLLLSAVVFFR